MTMNSDIYLAIRRQYGGLRIVRPTFPLVGRVILNAPLPVKLCAHTALRMA